MTPRQLALCTRSTVDRAERFAVPLTLAMQQYGIVTPIRQAMFLANIGHESGNLRYTTELWGPTPAQQRYEGRMDLGNIHEGDGPKYRGHGLIQTTGRANHVAARDRLRARFPHMKVPDFEENPDMLADPYWASFSACDYIDMRGLNGWADKDDFDGYCDLINRGRKTATEGDSNGWIDRVRIYTSARLALGLA